MEVWRHYGRPELFFIFYIFLQLVFSNFSMPDGLSPDDCTRPIKSSALHLKTLIPMSVTKRNQSSHYLTSDKRPALYFLWCNSAVVITLFVPEMIARIMWNNLNPVILPFVHAKWSAALIKLSVDDQNSVKTFCSWHVCHRYFWTWPSTFSSHATATLIAHL